MVKQTLVSGVHHRLWQLSIVISLVFSLTGLMHFSPVFAGPINAAKDPGLPQALTQQASVGITAVQYNEKSKAVQIVANQNYAGTSAQNYTLMKLPNPFRLVMDIPEASLSLPRAAKGPGQFATSNIPIRRDGIQAIELTETQGRFYRAVRVVIYVENAKTLWKLNANVQDNVVALGTGTPLSIQQGKGVSNLLGSPGAVQTATAQNRQIQSNTPLVPSSANGLPVNLQPPVGGVNDTAVPVATVGRDIIESIAFKDDRLEIKAVKGSIARVKNRFSLTQPSRLVIDLDNAVVASKDVLKPLSPSQNDSGIRQVRVGQFDEETVRVVIETAEPERIQTVYPSSDQTLLTVGMVSDAVVATLPSDTVLGQLQDVVVGKRQGDTVLRLSADAEIVHRLTRKGDKVILELLNISARPARIAYDEGAFKELGNVKTESLASGQPNSKVVVDLKNTQLDVNVELAADNKTLDLVFMPPGRPFSNGALSKAPYPARIVIDAGHGGKDMGANRDGVYEKDLNLQVAKLLKQELEKRGLQVYLTRSSDVFLPLPQITSIANAYHPDLFVSIHQNASTNPSLNGIETYYYTPQSLPLANKVHQKMVNNVSAPDRGVRRAMFYVIHHTPVPAILCEVGYISNAQERRELQSGNRQQRTANAIAEGVVAYLQTKVSAQAKPAR